MNINLYGVPLDLGSERIGVDMGPNALRYQKYVENLKLTGMNISDKGNIYCPSPEEVKMGDNNIKYLLPIAKVCRTLAKITFSDIKKTTGLLYSGETTQ